jgi:hypothetical protein
LPLAPGLPVGAARPVEAALEETATELALEEAAAELGFGVEAGTTTVGVAMIVEKVVGAGVGAADEVSSGTSGTSGSTGGGLLPAPSRHWLYQSFTNWQCQPSVQLASPFQFIPPHWPHGPVAARTAVLEERRVAAR